MHSIEVIFEKINVMKRITFLTVLFSWVFMGLAQNDNDNLAPQLPIDKETKLVTYQEVVQETGTPQELYDRAVEWAKKEYTNTNEVFKVQDREQGLLEMRSSVRIYSKTKDGKPFFKNIVYYRFKIECRENRYRFTITEFNERVTAAAPIEVWFDTNNPNWQPSHFEYLKQIDQQVKDLIISMKKGMMPKVEKVDEW